MERFGLNARGKQRRMRNGCELTRPPFYAPVPPTLLPPQLYFLPSEICTAAQLYTYPTASSSAFDASSADMTFTWDPDCTIATAGKVDITLYAPNLASSLVKVRFSRYLSLAIISS